MDHRNAKHGSILVVDDHKMVGNGIKLLLGDSFEHFYMAHDGADAISKALKYFPQLVIVDYFLPDTTGDLLVRELKYKIPSVKALGYSFTYSASAIVKMLQAGVNGYVIKNEEDGEFLKAVELLMEGRDYFCKEARLHIVNRFSGLNEDVTLKHLIANTKFSGKEIELIRMLCRQMNTKEISSHLCLTERTVEQYRSNISRKVGAKNLAGIIKFALQNGIFDLNDF